MYLSECSCSCSPGEVRDTANEDDNDASLAVAKAETEPPVAPSTVPVDVPLCQLLASSKLLSECVYDLLSGKSALNDSSEMSYLVTSTGITKNLVSKSKGMCNTLWILALVYNLFRTHFFAKYPKSYIILSELNRQIILWSVPL